MKSTIAGYRQCHGDGEQLGLLGCGSRRHVYQPGADRAGTSSIGLVVEVGSAARPGATNLAVVSNESDRNAANNADWDPTVVLQGK